MFRCCVVISNTYNWFLNNFISVLPFFKDVANPSVDNSVGDDSRLCKERDFIPNDILQHEVLPFLNFKEIAGCERISRRWQGIAQNTLRCSIQKMLPEEKLTIDEARTAAYNAGKLMPILARITIDHPSDKSSRKHTHGSLILDENDKLLMFVKSNDENDDDSLVHMFQELNLLDVQNKERSYKALTLNTQELLARKSSRHIKPEDIPSAYVPVQIVQTTNQKVVMMVIELLDDMLSGNETLAASVRFSEAGDEEYTKATDALKELFSMSNVKWISSRDLNLSDENHIGNSGSLDLCIVKLFKRASTSH